MRKLVVIYMLRNRFGKIICILLSLMIVLFACGCGGKTLEKREPTIYTADIAYIGHDYIENKNVMNVTVFKTLDEFNKASKGKDSIWIEEDILFDNMDNVKDLMGKTKSLFIISSSDKNALYEKITGEKLREKITCESNFLGLLFTRGNGDKYDAVGVYGGKENTEFMAFASLYDYASYYQGNTIKTDVYKTDKLADSFNVFDINGNAYAVSYMTIVDFVDNPSYSGGKYKFQHTVMQTTAVYPYTSDNIVNEFTTKINSGENSYIIAFAPEDEYDIEKNTENTYNFFFKRYFDISKDVKYKGVVRSFEKSFGAESASWSLLVLDKKNREIYTSDQRNITSALDIINTEGHYIPSYCMNLTINNGAGDVYSYEFTVEMNQWAIAWDDDYEE